MSRLVHLIVHLIAHLIAYWEDVCDKILVKGVHRSLPGWCGSKENHMLKNFSKVSQLGKKTKVTYSTLCIDFIFFLYKQPCTERV